MTLEQAKAIEGVREALREALIAGGDTRALREQLARLEQEVIEMKAAAAQAEAERQHQEAAEIARQAEARVADALARLRERMAALAPNF